LQFLLGMIQKSPDLYLDELQEVLATAAGVEVSRSTITLSDTLILFYKITCVAAEHLAEKCLNYLARIGKYEAEQLVFVDESSVDCRTTYRGRAWSFQGTKAQCKAFFV
ncbi:hypothetical protein OG21DRAFT_1417747, partial [Imleria badia]